MSKSIKVNGVTSSSKVWKIDSSKKRSLMVDKWRYIKRRRYSNQQSSLELTRFDIMEVYEYVRDKYNLK